jgi:hypothetical protein
MRIKGVIAARSGRRGLGLFCRTLKPAEIP